MDSSRTAHSVSRALFTLAQAFRFLARVTRAVPHALDGRLLVPFAVLALRYANIASLASVLALIFGVAFIGFEFCHPAWIFFWWAESGYENSPVRLSCLVRYDQIQQALPTNQ